MILKKLNLQNFRNYENQTFEFNPSINLICGENGQGKTNLLEAICALSTMRLFRTSQKKDGLKFDTDYASVLADFEAQKRDFNLELRLFRQKSMEIYKNGVKQKRQSDASGIMKTVLFCPDDLMLIRQGASVRRRFLDIALCQLRPGYARALEQYQKLHEHKTRILRDSDEKPSLLSMLDDFSLQMAHYGAYIIRYRAYYLKKLLEKASIIHSEIAKNEILEGFYKTVSSVENPYGTVSEIEQKLIDHVLSHKNAEIASKSCLSGPHKDDFILSINGKNAASFASQGQIRTCTLSLKLAERELFFEEDGEYPILLLDDVLSELDQKRQDFVLNRILDGQVMISCCEDGISEKLNAGAVFMIEKGKII